MDLIITSITAQHFSCSGKFLSHRNPLLQTYEQIKLIEENCLLIPPEEVLVATPRKIIFKMRGVLEKKKNLLGENWNFHEMDQ